MGRGPGVLGAAGLWLGLRRRGAPAALTAGVTSGPGVRRSEDEAR
ncbi:hypothetical protein ACGIF2_10345 [Cellulomonas sp. P22]